MKYFTFHFFGIKPLKPGVYVTLTVHLDSNDPCVKCSKATCG